MADGVTVTPKAQPVSPDAGSYVANETAPLVGFLNADASDARLQVIVDFFKEDGKDLMQADLLAKLRNLENRLGIPGLGEKRVDKIYRYIKLQNQMDVLAQQRNRELR